ncbi:hypothetical protein ACTWQL_18830 [Pseudalkalibacillus sp. R45]|uniref:hypothetical protein n=1 Tax=Pseudalkalibacillus sp. R45 TaxID=3457433 RepID=UPI003FCCEC85
MVSPVPLIPQESRTLLSNQLAQGVFLKMTQKQPSFRKEPKRKRALNSALFLKTLYLCFTSVKKVSMNAWKISTD